MPNQSLKKADIERLHAVKQFIDGNLNTTLSITLLSRRAGFNRDKFKTGFKQVFETTIHQYIIQKRMVAAQTLLLQTDKPMKEIAALVGYSQRNFYAVFKKFYGHPPKAERKA